MGSWLKSELAGASAWQRQMAWLGAAIIALQLAGLAWLVQAQVEKARASAAASAAPRPLAAAAAPRPRCPVAPRAAGSPDCDPVPDAAAPRAVRTALPR